MSSTETDVSDVDLSMRARQLASSVRQGRKLTFIILDENPVEGYLAGWDADTYFVIYTNLSSPTVQKTLIPKQSILRIILHDERTFREDDEQVNRVMDPLVKKFRDYINNTYFAVKGSGDK